MLKRKFDIFEKTSRSEGFAERLMFSLEDVVFELSPVIGENEEGSCTITRQFQGVDASGNVSANVFEQTITVTTADGGFCELCNESPNISGIILTEEYKALENSEVLLSGPISETVITGPNGEYFFENVPLGYNYTITPHLDSGHRNGITTLDIIFIFRHLLDIQQLDSPYKRIAADVNNSGAITTLDMIELRRLILGNIDAFGSNTSWRFVERAYEFPEPNNPWFEQFPEVISIDNLLGEMKDANFVGVKIGDVNHSAVTNSLMKVDNRELAESFTFEVSDRALKAGNDYHIEFRTSKLAEILGYQFTLHFDQLFLDLEDIEYGIATEQNIGLGFLNQGFITSSWHELDRNKISKLGESELMFTLVFRAKEDGRLSDLLGINSRYTLAEAYNLDDEFMDIAIDFGTGVQAKTAFELYQNKPNPFTKVTTVSFELPEAASATLFIRNVDGRMLKKSQGDFSKGYNEITISGDELPESGILYYTLATDKYTATRKMIRIQN